MTGVENGWPEDDSQRDEDNRPGLMRRFVEGFRGFMNGLDAAAQADGGSYMSTDPLAYTGPWAFMPTWDLEPRADEMPRVEPFSEDLEDRRERVDRTLEQIKEQDWRYSPITRALLSKAAFIPTDSRDRINVARYLSDGTLYQDVTSDAYVAAFRPDSEERPHKYDHQDVKDLKWLNKSGTTSNHVVGRLAEWTVFTHEPSADNRG